MLRETILVTGGCGFIGSNLIKTFIDDGRYRVVNLDLLTYAAAPRTIDELDALDECRLVEGSIADRHLVRAIIEEERPVAVLNLAAESHVDRSIDGPDAFMKTNVMGTYELLEASRAYWSTLEGSVRNAFRLVQVSTDEVFGPTDNRPFREDDPRRPSSPYAASKAAAESLIRAWGTTFGLPSVTVNSSNTYGPYQHPEKLIPHMILRALTGMRLPIYGYGRQRRNWMHVSDHVAGIRAVLENGCPGETYNIATNNEAENIEIVNRICEHLDQLAPRRDGRRHVCAVEHVQDRPGHDQRYSLETSKAKTEISFTPQTPLDDGLRETVRWYVENREWWESLMDAGYGLSRIGGMSDSANHSAKPVLGNNDV